MTQKNDSDTKNMALIEKLQGNNERSDNKSLLLETESGKKTHYYRYSAALKEAAFGLDDNDKIVTHRLRHTYATTLLNAGMSLVGVMKLLGHNDYQMTLRYTAITQETVGKEYFEALSELEKTYGRNLTTSELSPIEPIAILEDAIRLLQKKSLDDKDNKHVLTNLARRLTRIKQDLEHLTKN